MKTWYEVNFRQLVKSLLFFFKQRDRFSCQQFIYIFYLWIGLKHTNHYMKQKLEKILVLFIQLNDKYNDFFLLDDIKFSKVDKSLNIHLIGMYIDIMIKDEFFITSVCADNHKNIIFNYYQEGPYEDEKVQLERGDVVIDAGANMGVFSILAAKKGCIVYAFEPQNVFFNLLCRNIWLNHLSQVIHPICSAIGDINKPCILSIDNNNLLSASLSIHRGQEKIIVDCISIDHWVVINNISRIDFIKADIEGAERILIDGAKNSIQKWKPKLAISIYHLNDDLDIIKYKIMKIHKNYKFTATRHILFAISTNN